MFFLRLLFVLFISDEVFMARAQGQKLKLLYILRILERETDEEHPIATQQLVQRLEEYGIHSERKSLYDDMEKLMDFGYDIIHVQSRLGGGYYLANREFELAELKLLVDAVSSSRFITTKKSRELIKKLENKASRHEASKLQRQVYVAGRVKTENEKIYYSIDAIHNAILENRQLRFDYLEWNTEKKLVPRDDKARQVSPWALIWKDENYYLAAFDPKDNTMKHYRVDKIGNVTLCEEKRIGLEAFERIDLGEYANQSFGMFGGKQEVVTLSFPQRLVGVVLDRFGKEVDIRPMEGDSFRVRAKIVVSGQFFGWLSGIGKEAKIVAPESVREEYRCWIEDIKKGI